MPSMKSIEVCISYLILMERVYILFIDAYVYILWIPHVNLAVYSFTSIHVYSSGNP